MLFRTHITFSVFVGFLLLYILEMDFASKVLFMGFIVLATLFVDIDSRKSFIGNNWVFRPLQWFVKHRGMFHSLLVGGLLSLIVAGFSRWAGIGFFVGYISHLFMDLLTKQGIPLFWPLFFRKIGFGVRSGGIIEEILFVFFLLGDVFIFGKIVFESLF